MKKLIALLIVPMFATLPMHGGEKKDGGSAEIEKTDLVPSGTYTGTAHKVDPQEKEIYFKTEDGKLLELYLKEDTRLTKDGEKVAFDTLKEGQKLEVTVEKKDDSLKPVAVKVVEN